MHLAATSLVPSLFIAHTYFILMGLIDVLFCVCSGADGPQAMLRGAVLYGGLMYLSSGGLVARNELERTSLEGTRRICFGYDY